MIDIRVSNYDIFILGWTIPLRLDGQVYSWSMVDYELKTLSYLDCGSILLCWASRICCWMRYCWCKAWGRKGGTGMSWNGGAGMWLRGGCNAPAGWCAGPRWWLIPVWDCPGWGIGKSTGIWAWGPMWKCRQEVAWLCWCLLKWDPATTMTSEWIMNGIKPLLDSGRWPSSSPEEINHQQWCVMGNEEWANCIWTSRLR